MNPPKKPSNPYSAVHASDLGEGRYHTEVLVCEGDVQNAKAASRFLFVTKVANNQLSWNQVRFKNGEIYEISSKSIRGKRVSLFLWNESTEYL